MASNRNAISTDFRGIEDGTAFDDSLEREGVDDVTLTRIDVWAGEYINSLAMYYNGSVEAVPRGETCGLVNVLRLSAGEFVTAIEGAFSVGKLGNLTFVTNQGVRFGPFGEMNGATDMEWFVWKASDNVLPHLAPRMGLLYFSGYHDASCIHQLRATFALYPDREPGTIDVKYEKHKFTDTTESQVVLSSFARTIMSPVVTLVVGTDNVQFHAAEATLCRIPFFRAALQGAFQEATLKKISFPDDAPEIFSALLEHLYNGTYTYIYDVDSTMAVGNIPVCDLAQGCFHVRVHALASKYDWQPLVDAAIENFVVMLQKLPAMDIMRLWKVAYENGLTVSVCSVAGRLGTFRKALPTVLEGLYTTDAAEMESTVSEMPSLANDFIRLLVSSRY